MSIYAVKKKYEEQMRQLPNVLDVEIGEKEGRPIIRVIVRRKVPEDFLMEHEVIPKTLDGYETDVEDFDIYFSNSTDVP
jgi:hypothetical protein